MNAERLLQHFDRIAEAPDAIPRLRRFILDLAVRGKLVEQDPNDEPASELLKGIQVEKARLVKKFKALPRVTDDDKPFDLPQGWEWVRIRQVTIDRGQIVPRSDFTYIDVTAINKERGCIAEPKILSAAQAPSRARKLVQKGDVIYSCVRPYLLNIAVIDTDIEPPPIASTAFAVMYGFGLVLPQYLWVTLRGPFMVECVEASMRGQAYPAINDADFAMLPIPLPPLPEQHRIVAKVDELMALCDRLEAAKTEREQSRDRLVAASQHRINSPADVSGTDAPDLPARQADACRDYACFVLNHLSRLTTRPEHIKQLRQTILNLAVRGKLVPQDPSDEPAAELLKRIAVEKARLQREGLISAEKLSIAVPSIELPFSTPSSWQWVRLIDYATVISTGPFGSILHQSDYVKAGVPLVNPSHMVNGRIVPEQNITVSSETAMRLVHYKLQAGDIVMARRGEVGRAAVVYGEENGWLCGTGSFFLRFAEEVCREYLMVMLRCEFVRKYLVGEAVGITMVNLNHGIVKRMPLPLPPLAEQHRIVAKVDELMALCDQLEAQLTTSEADSRRLLEAVLHEALTPALTEID